MVVDSRRFPFFLSTQNSNILLFISPFIRRWDAPFNLKFVEYMIYRGLDLNKSGNTFMFIRNNGQLNGRAAIAALMLVAVTALTVTASIYPFATPIYGLGVSPDGSLLVADAGAGIVGIRKGVGSLIASLPGVTDVAPIGGGDMFAITSGADFGLYRVSRGSTRRIADLGAFEAEVNPDGGAKRLRTLRSKREVRQASPNHSPAEAVQRCYRPHI
jgi:hypothetical protein